MTAAVVTEALRETMALFDCSGTPQTTNEVADRLDVGRRSTYDRLERLVEHGLLETKKVGASARVWWRPPTPATQSSTSRSTTSSSASSAGSPADSPTWPPAAEVLTDDVLDAAEVGIFVLDEGFDVAWINEATERYFGLERERVVGRDKRRLVEERIAPIVDDSRTFAETVLSTYDDNSYDERFSCHLRGDDGRPARWLEHRSTPIETGRFAGGRVELYYDVTERRRSERALREAEQRFESLVQAVEEYAVFMLDPAGRIRTWNDGARRITGYERQAIVGEHVSAFTPDDDRDVDIPAVPLAEAADRGSIEDEGWWRRADGTTFWAHVTVTAIYDDGRLEGFATIARDLTTRREHERQLRRERDLIRRILDVTPVSIGVVTAEGDIQQANRYVEAQLDRGGASTDAYTLGDWDLYVDGEYVPVDDRPYMQVIETGEAVSGWKCQLVLPTGERRWLSISAVPLREDDRVERAVVCAENITRLEEQTRRLERRRAELESELEDVFDRVSDGFFGLDEQLRFTYLNDRAEALLDVDESDVLGRDVRDVVPLTDSFEDALRAAIDGREPVFVEDYHAPLGAWFETALYPSETGVSVYFRDVTERRERERALEESERRYRTLVDNFPDGTVVLLDEDLRYLAFGGETFDEDPGAEREGTTVHDHLPPALLDELEPRFRAAWEGTKSEVEVEYSGRVRYVRILPVRDDDGDISAVMGVSQDVTERTERERALEESERRYRTLVDNFPNGIVTLFDDDFRYLIAGGELYDVFDRSPDDAVGTTLYERGAPEEVALLEPHYRAALNGESSTFETEFTGRTIRFWTVPVADEAGEVFAGMAMSQDVTELRNRELDLERQREQLAALNNLNDIVRDVTDAVIDQSSREEIEDIVCERLARTDSYQFAWIGDVDTRTRTVNPRTEAGATGYLDDVTISIDPDDDRIGPAGRAILDGEIQTVRDGNEDPRYDPLRDHVTEDDLRSSAATPIVHDGAIYGVLNVYSDRRGAFADDERAMISQLGEIVGHAIASVERKRALLSDAVEELEFRIPDAFDEIDLPDSVDGQITFDQTVPVGGAEYLHYGTATGGAIEAIEAITDAEAFPQWDSMTVIGSDGGGDLTRFEIKVVDPPVVTALAATGGHVRGARIRNDDCYLSVHVSPATEVAGLMDSIASAYPQVELLARRQLTRSGPTPAIADDLTDRQRAALVAAYFSGYFDWPRETNGEAVADSLGISPSTFHYHLRRAQRTVLSTAVAEFSSVPDRG